MCMRRKLANGKKSMKLINQSYNTPIIRSVNQTSPWRVPKPRMRNSGAEVREKKNTALSSKHQLLKKTNLWANICMI